MPWQNQDVLARRVIVEGTADGVFCYDAANNLVSADVGQDTTDPKHGITCYAGISTFHSGFVINLLSTTKAAFFQYNFPVSSQGSLILAVASQNGTDPVTATPYTGGLTGVDPVFGDFLKAVGSVLTFGIAAAFSRNATMTPQQGSGPSSPYLKLDAPEQGVASHLQMLMQGTSPDGSHPGQFLIGAVSGAAVLSSMTSELLEIQGNESLQGGLLVYNGTPALGTLIAELFASPHTDKYGNQANTGLNVGVWSAVTPGPPLQHFGVDLNGEIFLADATGTRVFISGLGTAGGGTRPAIIEVRDSTHANLAAAVADAAGTAETSELVAAGFNGPITAWHPGTTPNTAETVQTITTGFPAGVTGTISYWMSPLQEGIVFVQFGLTLAASTTLTAGTVISTGGIAAAYRPPVNDAALSPIISQFGATTFTPAPVGVNTAGSLTFRGATLTTPAGGTSAFVGLCMYQTAI